MECMFCEREVKENFSRMLKETCGICMCWKCISKDMRGEVMRIPENLLEQQPKRGEPNFLIRPLS